MAEAESRVYQISGNLTHQQWDEFLHALGGIGVSAERIEAPQLIDGIDPEVDPANAVNKSDFIEFAAESGEFTKFVATRAWNVLGSLHDHKVNADYWANRGGGRYYNPDRYAHSTLRYGKIRRVAHGWRHDYDERLSNLDLQSLVELMGQLDEASKEHAIGRAAHDVLGRNAGQRTAEFLRAFVAAKLEDILTTETVPSS